jgi:hypothetical protein
MKHLQILLVVFLLFAVAKASGQTTDPTDQMISKIDSIAKARNITAGTVYYHRITSTFDNTTTMRAMLSSKKEFSFDGRFLVMGENYFNLDKLIYFTVGRDNIDFFFQAY